MDMKFSTFFQPLFIASVLVAGINPSYAQQGDLSPLPGSEFLQDAVAIDHIDSSICVLQSAGDVFCLNEDSGSEALNLALDNDIAAIHLLRDHLCGIGKTSGVACIFIEDNPFARDWGLNNPPEANANYIALATADSFARNMCAIQTDNRVTCWGDHVEINDIPAEAQYLQQVEIHGPRACGIDLNGMLICWGRPDAPSGVDLHFGDVDPNTIGAVKDISLGNAGSCIVDSLNQLTCYNFLDAFSSRYTDVSFETIEVQPTFRTVLCYETTSGESGCDAINDRSTENSSELLETPVSNIPPNVSPRLFSYDDSACVISDNNDLQCYFYPDDVASVFPIAPEGLRAEIYSNNAIELFWDRPTKEDGSRIQLATGFEIYRNGVLLERSPNIVSSYFDGDADVNAVYEVRSTLNRIGGAASSLVPDGSQPVEDAVPVPNNIEPDTTDDQSNQLQLTGQVYSSSAIELTWNRATDTNTRYNIFRNGNLIRSQSPAVSQYDPNLLPGTSYEYVVEVVLNGNVITSSSIVLTTAGEFGAPVTASQTTASSLAPELSGAVYSSNAVELFWNRIENANVSYNIYRNNELIRGDSVAVSQYDPNLAPATTYTYRVETIENGIPSGESTIELTTQL